MTQRTVSGIDPETLRPIAVTVADGTITAIEPGPTSEDRFLSPGLIDLQVNGFAGIDLNSGDLTPKAVEAFAAKMFERGITSFVPTLITASEASIVQGLNSIRDARARSKNLARAIPFVHVEGPALSPEGGPRGAHPLAYVRPPDLEEFARWQSASDNLVGLVTLSPHYPNAPDYIAALTKIGVHVSIGHTDATPDQIRAAVQAGARLSTHLGNGVAATLPRHPNMIWAQLDADDLTAMFIGDGHHLPADTFRVMLRAKGLDRAILVSDCVALGGLPPGRYTTPIGGEVDISAQGRITMAGTPYLAGAGMTLDQNVAIATRLTGLDLGKILPLATRNPGRFAGGRRGQLAIGAPADLIRFRFSPGDPALAIETVLLGGDQIR